tara:strand:+ start:154 stop:528 length:375 start_codon:yes stop_codon:yes gene_type:complete
MSFDLAILLPNIEIKKTKIYLLDFLSIDSKTNSLLHPITSFNHHLNHAELIIDKLTIKGNISSKIDIEEFILSLLKFEKKLNKEHNFKSAEWSGLFRFDGNHDGFVYRAPCFKQEETKRNYNLF